jgi:nicotinamidase-related amidase
VYLLENLVDTSVSIVATPILFTPDYQELVDPVGILKTIKEVGAFQAETKGAKMIEQLLPFRSNILEVPGKRGFNAFTGTNLTAVLKDRQITSVVLAGAVTSICIDSTGRSAHEQGYQVSVLSDCTSARTVFEQDFYFDNVFPLYAEVVSSVKFLKNLGVDT